MGDTTRNWTSLRYVTVHWWHCDTYWLCMFYRTSVCEGGLGSRNSVSLSMCLSVCLFVTCVDCDKSIWCTADILIPHERAVTLLLWHQQWRNRRSKWLIPFEQCRLCQISAYNVSTVRDMTNKKSTTGFPACYRWSAYITTKPRKGGSKSDFFPFLSISQWLIISGAVNLVRRWVS